MGNSLDRLNEEIIIESKNDRDKSKDEFHNSKSLLQAFDSEERKEILTNVYDPKYEDELRARKSVLTVIADKYFS